MIDISDVAVKNFDVEGVEIQVVLPKSDTKVVVIPSPPTETTVEINPRPAVILLIDNISDELKAYAKENKVVYVIPSEDADADDIAELYPWILRRGKSDLNVDKNQISIAASAEKLELAQAAAEIIQDDEDIEDPVEFTI